MIMQNHFILSLLIVPFLTIAHSSICGKKDGESCNHVGTLKGLVLKMEGVTSALQNIVSSAKHRAETIEEDFCISPRINNCTSTAFSSSSEEDPDDCVRAEPDCKALYNLGFRDSGPYRIWPVFLNHSVIAYCDMHTDGGGWTVIQKRGEYEPHVSFFRLWSEYQKGFGDVQKEYWLGNDAIFALTNQAHTLLRIDLEDFDGEKRYAKYKNFLVRSEVESYKMTVGDYEGTAGDALRTHHNGKEFSTRDRGNHCPGQFKGGWWYGDCHEANMNGLYHHGNHTTFADGVNWYHFRGHNHSMKQAEMKIRRFDW